MKNVHRQGDRNTGGGIAQRGVNSVIVNNKPIVVNGTPVSGHPRRHQPVTANGLSKVVAGNKPVNVLGNADTCGHSRSGGSPNVVASNGGSR